MKDINAIVLLLILAMLPQYSHAVDEVETATLCAASIAIVAAKMDEPIIADVLFEEAKWFGEFTTSEAIESKMKEIQYFLNQDWDRVWPVIIQASEACSAMKVKIEAK